MQRRICEKCGKEFWWRPAGRMTDRTLAAVWVWIIVAVLSGAASITIANFFGSAWMAVIVSVVGLLIASVAFEHIANGGRRIYPKCPACGSQGIDPNTPLGKELRGRWQKSREEVRAKATSDLASAFRPSPSKLQEALDDGGDVNASGNGGWTPLMEAISNGWGIGSVRLLLNAGAKVNAATDDGRTPLLLAVEARRSWVVKMLLRRSADVKAMNRGRTPLMLAASGPPRVLKSLIAAGANVDAEDPEGNTALDLALSTGNHKAVKVLMEAGARVKAKQQVHAPSV